MILIYPKKTVLFLVVIYGANFLFRTIITIYKKTLKLVLISPSRT